MITLIANTGVQMFTTKVKINLQNIREKMYFHEWFDMNQFKLSMEIAHYFSSDDVYVNKHDLWLQGFMPNGSITCSWNEIQRQTSDVQVLNENEVFAISMQSLLKNDCKLLNKFLNTWLPFPYFEYNALGKTNLGPFNWARIKVIPTGNVVDNQVEWDICVAVDTTSVYDDGNYNDEYRERPVFPNEFERSKKYGVCDNDFNLLKFCSDKKTEWIDHFVMQLVHDTIDVNKIVVNEEKGEHRFTYLASFIYFLNLIRSYAELPNITLFKDRNVDKITNVDVVVDMGNSKTTALLVEESDFTRTGMLSLQDFTRPNRKSVDSFDMNIAFQKANFGEFGLGNSKQFQFPSFIRLGDEARYLIYHATNGQLSNERLSICSSPKRYLWDTKKRKYEWEYVQLSSETRDDCEPIWIEGISNQLNEDGTLSKEGIKGDQVLYSRRSLMTFSFLEILSQARMQINGYDWRHRWGDETSPRRIGKIIITCPTAMSSEEQISLRKAAEEAYVLLYRYINGVDQAALDYKSLAKKIEIIPSVMSLQNKEEHTQWSYDEATCSQFVYLCAELAERYKNNCKEYFDLYGKVRNDLPGYNGKSLTVGSLDIGAGTTDLMICAYEYSSMGQTTIKPIPLFWESFYTAGDDMLKALVQQIIIEGPFAMISNRLQKMGSLNSTILLADFFGHNNARMDFSSRMLRKDFNMQISVPIALKYLELAQKNVKESTILWQDIFSENQPSLHLLDAFYSHFGFRIEEVEWSYELDKVNSIIVSQFDDLLRKVTAAMSAYGCDVIVLSGRPTSLKQVEDIFLKYYPVSPNRLKVLNDYRVGRWYPFQNGDGYFSNQKSIVAVGALLGYIASTQGGFHGLSIDLSELQNRLLPTTEFFGAMNSSTNEMKASFITPVCNSADLIVNDLPLKIGTRQLDTLSYPSRSFYKLSFNEEAIEAYFLKKGFVEGADLEQALNDLKKKIRTRTPLTMKIVREAYSLDKEKLVIESVVDRNGDDEGLPINFFSLQVQSLSEDEDFWLDSGVFQLSITAH